jgi:malate dehydrogenase (oxaloacetate-decarboxylating)
LRALVKEGETYSKTSRLSIIVTDGTAILGLGNIGPKAGLPVMEGKSLLFRMLGDVEVVPLCMFPQEHGMVEFIANTVGNFMAVNLEDIKAPECFDIEAGLDAKKLLPVFHDDQHGTAIVTLAAFINALKLTDRKLEDMKIIINGAGAAGVTIAKLFLAYGAKHIIACDTKGVIYKGRAHGMNASKKELAEITNLKNEVGNLEDVLQDADVFIGVSVGGALKKEWIKKMNKPIIFAMANPIPEVFPDEAK